MSKKFEIFGVKLSAINLAEAKASLHLARIIFTPNPEILLLSRKNAALKTALNSGDLLLPDGNGLQLVTTISGIKNPILRVLIFPFAAALFFLWRQPFAKIFPEIIHGSDFMKTLIEYAVKKSMPVYFLGGFGSASMQTANFFKNLYPDLIVAGHSNLDPGKEALSEIQSSKAEILFIAYGAPKQEIWLSENINNLPKIRQAMTVGGSFDFYSGKIKRAPSLMRHLKLEWLWRLIQEPRRIKRIWRATIVFPLTYFFASP